MKEIVLITGANGMLAKQLEKLLSDDYSIRFLSRKAKQDRHYLWDIERKYIDPKALIGVKHIIHLAGSSIAEKRWSKKRKEDILSSRVDSAHLILEELKKNNIRIDTLISASAVGFYGTKTTDKIYDEDGQKGKDYLSNVCREWEKAADVFKSENIAERVSVLRIGVILAKNDGALKKIVRPIKYGLGSPIGNGHQYMPWIHIQDLCGIIRFTLKNKDISGTFNTVSPEHITNSELTREIAKQVRRKLFLPNIPSFIIKGLFGEMATVLLEGSRVSANKILSHGFKFEYHKLTKALKDVL